MRVFVEGNFWEPHLGEHLEGKLGPLLSRRADAVNQHRLGQDLADDHPRIQRSVWVLEDDLDAPLVAHEFARRHRQDVASFEQRLACGGFMEPHQRETNGRLAGA